MPEHRSATASRLDRERRFKLVAVTPDALLRLLSGKVVVADNGVPADSQPAGAIYDVVRDSFVVRVYHPSFPAAQEGACIEWLPPIMFEDRR